jgi:hypothetical protein
MRLSSATALIDDESMSFSARGIVPPTLLLVSLLATSAMAAPSASTRVSDVEVTAGPGPKVVSSFPADGGSAPAGVLVLKVTFDQPMTPKAWGYGPSDQGDFPTCLAQPRLLADQRTFALLCTVAPNKTYAVEINPTPDFRNATGRSAKDHTLRFTTTETGTRDLHDALSQAGLTDADEPLMSWDDPGKGVSQSPPPSDDQAAPKP